MKLIVGLGNPELKAGEKYANTRHNLGFDVLEHFRKKLNLPEWENNSKLKTEIIKTQLTVILIRPQTYMNNSGQAVSLVANYFKISPQDIIVVHDELDLPLGHIKLRLGGGFAGHHGVESVLNSLGTDQFIRLRLGVGNLRTQGAEKRGGEHFNTEHFVLDEFLESEKHDVKHMTKKAIKAIEIILKDGVEKAQNQFNQ